MKNLSQVVNKKKIILFPEMFSSKTINEYKLEKKICKYEIISFDIFDTLVSRCVQEPKDIFTIVENIYNNLYKKNVTFARERIDAEKRARDKHIREVSLEQIYAELCIQDKEIFKMLEIEVELAYCVPNPIGKCLFEKAIKNKKQVIIISDMYLPKVIIEKILDKCKIKGYSSIYISCECGMTKASGEIYEYVLKDLNAKSKDIIHIGDNCKSDWINAKINKINAKWLKNNNLKGTNELERFLECKKVNECDYVGYSCLGPLLFGFVQWLHKIFDEKKYDNILFLSRDGWIIKKAYETVFGKSDVNKYFYASRKALLTASFCLQSNYEEIIKSMFVPRKFRIKWLLERWGIDTNSGLINTYLNECGFDLETYIDGTTILDNQVIKGLYEICKEKLVDNSTKQCEEFVDYWNSVCTGDKVAIVDIGWYGNMQKSLELLLKSTNKEIEIEGYYLGVVPSTPNKKCQRMKGYLFDNGKNEDYFWQSKYFSALLELFFIAPHGSLKMYEKRGKNKFVYEEYEYENTETGLKVANIQNKAIEFLKDYKEIGLLSEISERDYFNNLLEYFAKPTYRTAKEYGDISINDAGVKKLACPKWSSRGVINDFLTCSWKVGYLKRLIKLPLPYTSILIFFRRK